MMPTASINWDWDSLPAEAKGLVFDVLETCHDDAFVVASSNTKTRNQALEMAARAQAIIRAAMRKLGKPE